MRNETFLHGLLELMRGIATAEEGAPTRCRLLALGLYRLADRMGPKQQKLARRLRLVARRLACAERGAQGADGNRASLPPRHARVMGHLLAGASEKDIARKLALSPHTVHEYVKEIYRQLGVGSRAELVAMRFAGDADHDDPPFPGTPRVRDSSGSGNA